MTFAHLCQCMVCTASKRLFCSMHKARCRAAAQCSRHKISDHMKRAREVLSMPDLWEQSLVYTRSSSTSGKNDVNTEEMMVDGTEDLVFKRK